MQVNLIEWSCEVGDIFIAELEQLTQLKYSVEDEEGTSFTEEGQEIFNSIYDKLRDFFETTLQVREGEYEIEIEVKDSIKSDRDVDS